MLEERELLAQSEILKNEIGPLAESRPKGSKEAEEDGSHHVKMLEVGRGG